MAEIKLEAEVKDIGNVYRVDAPFDEALKTLKTKGVREPISSRDLAYARIQNGKDSTLCSNGSYTREGFEYAPNKPVLLKSSSRLLNQRLSKKAVQTNANGSYFTVPTEIYEQDYEQAQKDLNKEPEKRKVLVLPSKETFDFTFDSDTAKALFKDQAEEYFDFIGQESIRAYLIGENHVNEQDNAVLTQLWLCSLDDGSDLGGVRDLSYNVRVRGVSGETSEAGRKTILPYTQRELAKVSKIVSGVREGNLPASKLEKTLGFLEKLKE